MSTSEKIEEFLSNFTRDYIRVFNMLERNISYSLSYMVKKEQNTSPIQKVQALSFCKKIKGLNKIITKKNLYPEFADLLENIEECRTLRNNLVHGHWEVAWWLDKPIRFDACEVAGNNSKSISGDFTTKELSEKLYKLEQVGNDFSELRKQYEKLKN